MTAPHLLAGPDPRAGAESLAAHVARLGALPAGGNGLVDVVERSDLRGRGGASFPVGTKWRAVTQRKRGDAVVLVNGAEGEPLSHKDRLLMRSRPHLVLDGAILAADAVGAREVVVYVGQEHTAASTAIQRALAERPDAAAHNVRLLLAPPRYVAGEESAAVHCVNEGLGLPTATPPRPFERGVAGKPTLVQNVESLAHAALIARSGDAWFRDAGVDTASGTALVTVSGAVPATTVLEVAQGTTVTAAVSAAGGLTADAGAVLLGGYFGGWVLARDAWSLPLDPVKLRHSGRALGCGVIAVLPASRCGVVATAQIARYLAEESAGQCGPCVFGLRAMADALQRIAACAAEAGDLARLQRWTAEIRGRGACKHPDGAAGMVGSAFEVFAQELAGHVDHRRCTATSQGGSTWTL